MDLKVHGWKERTLPAVLAAALLLCPLTGCGDSGAAAEAPELIEPVGVDVDTATVKKMDLSGVESYQGQIIPEIKDLYFVNSGNIGEMKVSPGDKVKKGQLLATLTSVDANVKKLQEQIKEKQAENKDANEISKCDIEKLREEVLQLEKQVKAAKGEKQKKGLRKQVKEKQEDIKLAKLRLTQQKENQALEIKQIREDISDAKKQTKESKLISPVNGEIISTAGGSGYMVQGGTTAIRIANMDKPRIQTEFIGDSVLGGASSYLATVNGKQYRVKKEEQEFTSLEIEMGQKPPNSCFDFEDNVKLNVGDTATIDFYSDMAKDALVVPSNAVFRDKQDAYVYLMNGNVKKRTSVTTGTVTDAYTQLLTGVKEGDVVYVQD